VWSGFITLKTGASGGLFEHGNETLDSIFVGNLAEQLLAFQEILSSMELV
jgi:hypothetical protein